MPIGSGLGNKEKKICSNIKYWQYLKYLMIYFKIPILVTKPCNNCH
jgi:hypothetical protein